MTTKRSDEGGYLLSMILFSIAIPVIGAVGYWMAHELRPVTSGAPIANDADGTTAGAAAPSEAAPSEAPAAEARGE